MIQIDILYGISCVENDDKERAKAAASKILEAFEWLEGHPIKIDPQEAYTAYKRYMSDEEYLCTPQETILIAAWEAAENAADKALTEGWYNPNGANCSIWI